MKATIKIQTDLGTVMEVQMILCTRTAENELILKTTYTSIFWA